LLPNTGYTWTEGIATHFIFHYNNVAEGYKMVGNAVPCHLAYYLAKAIKHVFMIGKEALASICFLFLLCGKYRILDIRDTIL
jgi:hypothetical protein